MSATNPFAALLNAASKEEASNPPVPLENILEHIFSFTLNAKKSNELLLLDEMLSENPESVLSLDTVNHALFARLFMCNQKDNLIEHGKKEHVLNKHSYESRSLIYLYEAYTKLETCKDLKEGPTKETIKEYLMLNVATAIIQPDIYDGQDLPAQMIEILKSSDEFDEKFFEAACKKVVLEESDDIQRLSEFIRLMVKKITNEIIGFNLITFNYNIFNVLRCFLADELTANIFMDCIQPDRSNIGSDYGLTALGAILNISVIPKAHTGKYDHFTNPMDVTSNSRLEGILWDNVEKLSQETHALLLAMLKSSSSLRNRTLSWLGSCLKANSYRGKIWSSQAPLQLNPATYTTVTDGFMINLCNVMLRLCQPLCGKKILKVDPTYTAVTNEQMKEKSIHMFDLSEETCVLSIELGEERPTAASAYNFVTECFYITHKAIDLGYRVAVDHLIRKNHEMGRIERTFQDALQSGGNSEMVNVLKERMTSELAKFLSLKCQLSDPILVNLMFEFISSSCYWMTQVAIHTENNNKMSFMPSEELPIKFPISTKVPDTLKCIPEFLIENIVSYLVFLRRFNPKVFEEQGLTRLEPVLTFILIFMGSQNHVKNPHIRARLAESLESLLPYHKDDDSQGINSMGSYQREQLFVGHPHCLNIVENVMHVFVGIEMTGQSVEFEQKFNYRRPMYAIIEYLWTIPEQMKCFKKLAEDAEQNMEAVNPPLFLRFANLLMNDAIFLLDEALSNMAKIKEMQQAQENGEWQQLPERERAQNVSSMHHIGMLARFDNILGKDTISTLEKLTSNITNVFTHSTMVDRVASMLNYFLLNLVGPNKKNFKVNNSKEYSFNPAATVLEICKIYCNLKESDAFCLAVSQDGRSYSPNLFVLASDVLARIGGGTLVGELQDVAARVAIKASEYKASEEAISEAPEHYLDPIMSTLMTDPVILPSSKQTVDRTTIARHLLSDQSDPFNRSPLSMDQIIPNVELAAEIKAWLAERLK